MRGHGDKSTNVHNLYRMVVLWMTTREHPFAVQMNDRVLCSCLVDPLLSALHEFSETSCVHCQ